MKLAMYTPKDGRGGQPRLGAVLDGQVVDLAGSGGETALASIHALLAAGNAGKQAAEAALRRGGELLALEQVTLRAPIARPGKILALAGNYRSHRAEGGVASPEPARALPELFCKPVTSVIGPEEPIRLPGSPVVAVDYEGELGVVIGERCSRVSEDEAMRYVAGYL